MLLAASEADRETNGVVPPKEEALASKIEPQHLNSCEKNALNRSFRSHLNSVALNQDVQRHLPVVVGVAELDFH